MASLDTRRPARAGTASPCSARRSRRRHSADRRRPDAGRRSPQRSVQAARCSAGHDVVILDTAGRTHIDEPLMDEMAEIKRAASPHEILLVADYADRPGRRATWPAPSTTASASPASC